MVVVVVLGLFGIFTLTKKNGSDNSSGGSSNSTAQTSEHKKGEGTSGVTLIEYGDLQCPACKSYFPIVKQIEAEYGDKVTVQYRHYPLNQVHPHAFEAARAAEAAGLQGKFFEMHDLMYENQDSWSQSSNVSPIFEIYAQQLGLNMEQFKSDSASKKVADTINADIKAGQAIGANSTPTFVLNGVKIQNPQDFAGFKQLIDEAIAKAGGNQP